MVCWISYIKGDGLLLFPSNPHTLAGAEYIPAFPALLSRKEAAPAAVHSHAKSCSLISPPGSLALKKNASIHLEMQLKIEYIHVSNCSEQIYTHTHTINDYLHINNQIPVSGTASFNTACACSTSASLTCNLHSVLAVFNSCVFILPTSTSGASPL